MNDDLEFLLGPEHLLARRKIALFVQQEIAELEPPHDDDAAREQARQLLKRMGQAGWLGALIPGGPPEVPRDSRTICLFREAVAGYSPLADATFAVQGLGTQPLILEGKEEWLKGALEGELMTAFAMTEAEAGSDVANIQTLARPDPQAGSFLLSGEKTLISNAGIADGYVVFASLDPGTKSRGLGAFWVTRGSPGFTFAGPQKLSAPHPLGRLQFTDCPARLISRDGFKLRMRTLDVLRVSVAAAACGMGGRALREAILHAKTRRQFGKTLGEFQLVQQKLAQMAIGLDAARLLTYRAAWMKDMGHPNSQEVAMAKAFATETAQRIIDQSMQVLGGHGMLASHPVEHLYRAVRSLRIYEGTTEVQHLIIAKGLLQ